MIPLCSKCGHLDHKSKMHQNVCTQYVPEHGAECGCSYQEPATAEPERKLAERIWDAGTTAWYAHKPGSSDTVEAVAAISRVLAEQSALVEELLAAAEVPKELREYIGLTVPRSEVRRWYRRLRAAITRVRGMKP